MLRFAYFTIIFHIVSAWEVSLEGGVTTGRVVVKPNVSSQKGTVCSDGFKNSVGQDGSWFDNNNKYSNNNFNALAACHSAGMPSSIATFTDAFGPGDASSPIWIESVNCSSTHYFLDNCSFNTLGNSNCQHGDDVGVKCNIPTYHWVFNLTGGASPSSGLVLLKPLPHLPRGAVRRAPFDSEEEGMRLRVAMCNTLGFPIERPSTARFASPPNLPRYFNPVSCPVTATGITACHAQNESPFLEESTWGDGEHLGIHCNYLNTNLMKISLIDGPKPWTGNVMVQFTPSDAMGPACYRSMSERWDPTQTDAMRRTTLNAICRQLGYDTNEAEMRFYKNRGEKIQLDWNDCSGAQTLSQCKLSAFDNLPSGCGAREVAGIDCFPYRTFEDVEVMLVRGFASSNGQILYRINQTSQWNALSVWSLSAAGDVTDSSSMYVDVLTAICRRAGFSSGLSPQIRYFGPKAEFPIWGDVVRCGGRLSFEQCSVVTKANPTYNQDEYGGVDCFAEKSSVMTRLYRIADNGRFEMRLVSDNGDSTPWGSICVDEVNAFDVWDAACASVNRSGGSSVRKHGNGSVPFYLSDIQCPISAATAGLGACSSAPIGSHRCAEDKALFISCNDVPVVPLEWTVQLFGNGSPYSGFVGLKPNRNSPPGVFCETEDVNTLISICRTMGFENSTAPRMTRASMNHGYAVEGYYFYGARCNPYYNLSHCEYRHFQAEFCRGMVINCFPIPDDSSRWSLRLAGGSVASEGRLEVRPSPDSEWGTICGYAWSQSETIAACKSLGFFSDKVLPRQRDINFFGYGTGPIWLSSFVCGSSQYLQNCSYFFNAPGAANANFYCGHGNDVALECLPPPLNPKSWEFRFVQYSILWPDRLRVEMRPSALSEWGTVSQSSLDMSVALAACTMAGYTLGVANFLPPVQGGGRVFAVNFECAFGVRDLRNCSNDEGKFGNTFNHGNDLTVDCNPITTDPRLWIFTLKDGLTSSSGRLQIRPSPSAQEGTVCSRGFSHMSAVAACKSSGFDVPPPRAAQMYTNPTLQTVGRIWVSNMSCQNQPMAFLQNCTDYSFSDGGCTHADDVWLECYPRIEVRIVDGPSPSRGRLTVRNIPTGQWGTVCNDEFSKSYAAWNAACRSAGFWNASFALYENWGPGTGPINLDDVMCPDTNRTTLDNCSFSPYGTSNCIHEEDAGIDCFPPLPPSGWMFRLAGGTSTSGRIEMQPAKQLPWGGICPLPSFNHTFNSWISACLSVGIATTRAVPKSFSEPMSGMMFLDNVYCGSKMHSLSFCNHSGLSKYDCPIRGAVGVDCDPPAENPASWSVRLAGGSVASKGRVEIMLNTYGLFSEPWGTVCGDGGGISKSSLIAICGSAGFVTENAVLLHPDSDSYVPAFSWQPIYLSDIACPPGSLSLGDCEHAPLYSHQCTHAQDIFVDCFPPTTAPPPTSAPTPPTTTPPTTTPQTTTTAPQTTTSTATTTSPIEITTSLRTTTMLTTPSRQTSSEPTTARPTGPLTTAVVTSTTMRPVPTTLPSRLPTSTAPLSTTTPPSVRDCDLIQIIPRIDNGILTDKLIREKGVLIDVYSHDASVDGDRSRQNWKNMSQLSVHRPSLNTGSDDVSTFFTFKDVYTGTREPEGFWYNFMNFGESGSQAAKREIICHLVNRTLIQCVLPPTEEYFLSAAEGIFGRFDLPLGLMLEPACSADQVPAVLSVHVEADTSDPFGAAVDAIGTISNGVGALIGALIGASVMEIQYVSVQMQSLCMSELDRRSSEAMRYFLSPFIDFHFAAVAFGNVAIAVIAGLSQYALSIRFTKSRGISQRDAWAAVRFPSLSYGISQVFYMGLCYGTFKLLATGDGLAVFGGAVSLFILAGYMGLLIFFVRATVRAIFVNYDQFRSRPFHTRWLYPLGFWDPDNLRLSYGHMINPFREGCMRYNLQQFIVGFFVTLFMVVEIDCFIRFIFVALVFAGSGCAHLYGRPSRLPPVNFLCALAQFMMSVWCILSAVAIKNPSKLVERAKLMLALCQVFVILFRAAYDLVITVLEESTWRHFRNPDLRGHIDDKGLIAESNKKAFMEGVDMEELLRIGSDRREKLKRKTDAGARPVEGLTRPSSETHAPHSHAEAPLLAEISEDFSPVILGDEEMEPPPPPPIHQAPPLSYVESIMRDGMAGMLDAFPTLARERHIQIILRLWDIGVDERVEDPAELEQIVLSVIAKRLGEKKGMAPPSHQLEELALDPSPPDIAGTVGAAGDLEDLDVELVDSSAALDVVDESGGMTSNQGVVETFVEDDTFYAQL